MIKEVVVVEGRDDTVAIRRAVEADTIETNGSAIDEKILRRIAVAQERRGVIVFTDPDHAGERIRKLISRRIPGCKHAFLSREDALHRGDIGVENASVEAIRHALAHVRTDYTETVVSEIQWSDLIDAGLIVHPDAARRRETMGELLGIGYANGKQFFKRCGMFRVSMDEFSQAYKTMIERKPQ